VGSGNRRSQTSTLTLDDSDDASTKPAGSCSSPTQQTRPGSPRPRLSRPPYPLPHLTTHRSTYTDNLTGSLTAQHSNFVAQDEDLHVLGRGAAGEQPEPAEQLDRSQIQQSKQHSPRSCHDHMVEPEPKVTACVTSFGTAQGLIHEPPITSGVPTRPRRIDQQRRKPLHPPEDRHVVNGDSAQPTALPHRGMTVRTAGTNVPPP
jgi:hypothetical protein